MYRENQERQWQERQEAERQATLAMSREYLDRAEVNMHQAPEECQGHWQEQQEAERQADLAVIDEYQDRQEDILRGMTPEEYQEHWWQEQQEAERLSARENSENQDQWREQQEETEYRGAPGTGPLTSAARDQAGQSPGTAVSRLESPENPGADDVHPHVHHASRLDPDVPAGHDLGPEGARIGAPGSPTLPNQEHGTAPVPEGLGGQRAGSGPSPATLGPCGPANAGSEGHGWQSEISAPEGTRELGGGDGGQVPEVEARNGEWKYRPPRPSARPGSCPGAQAHEDGVGTGQGGEAAVRTGPPGWGTTWCLGPKLRA